MPRLPVLTEQEVAPRPLPGPYQDSVASPAFFDKGGLARAASKVLGAVNEGITKELVEREQRRRLTEVEEVFTKLNDAYFGFKNSVQEARKGAGAQNLAADFLGWFDEAYSGLAGELNTPEQKESFRKLATRLRNVGWEWFANYEASEVSRYNKAVADAALERTLALALDAVSDEAAQISKRTGIDIIKVQLASAGLTDQKISDNAILEYTTKLHAARLEQLLERSVPEAKAYFDAWREEMSPSVRGRWRDKLTRLAETDEAEKFVEDHIKAGKSYDDIATLVRERFNGKQQDEALRVLGSWKADVLEREKQAREDVVNKAMAQFIAGGYSMRAIPAKLRQELLELSPKDYMYMQNIEESRIEKLSRARGTPGGKADASDRSEAYYGLYREFLDDPYRFSRKDLLKDPRFHLLTESDKQEIMRLQKQPERIGEVARFDQQLSTAAMRLGLNPSGSKSDREKYATFVQQMRRILADKERAMKRPLNYEEREKLISDWVVEGEIKGTGWLGDRILRDKARRFETYGLPEADRFIPMKPIRAERLEDIPASEVERIRESIRRAGRVATPQAIIEIWNSKNQK